MLDNIKDSPDHVAGWYGRGRRFLMEARSELSRVTWPTRAEVTGTTIVVILTSMLFGVYLWLVDLGLSYLMVKIG
jgi:preprotein translocase subunit SecE